MLYLWLSVYGSGHRHACVIPYMYQLFLILQDLICKFKFIHLNITFAWIENITTKGACHTDSYDYLYKTGTLSFRQGTAIH